MDGNIYEFREELRVVVNIQVRLTFPGCCICKDETGTDIYLINDRHIRGTSCAGKIGVEMST